jgi:hypothetical protein
MTEGAAGRAPREPDWAVAASVTGAGGQRTFSWTPGKPRARGRFRSSSAGPLQVGDHRGEKAGGLAAGHHAVIEGQG